MKPLLFRPLAAVAATLIAAVCSALVGGLATAGAQETINPRKLEFKPLLETEPVPTYSFNLSDFAGDAGAFKLVESPHGMLQVNTRSGECTLLGRDDKGAVTRTEIAPPTEARTQGSWPGRSGLDERRVPVGHAKVGSFEVVVGKVGTLLHSTRDGSVWQLERSNEGKWVWASTDPNAARPGDAYLGVSAEAAEGGIRVTQVYAGSAAAAVGIVAGDILEQADGVDLKSGDDLRKAVRAKKAGEPMKLRVRRVAAGKTVTFTVEVTLGEYR